jgi:hypothetical protein
VGKVVLWKLNVDEKVPVRMLSPLVHRHASTYTKHRNCRLRDYSLLSCDAVLSVTNQAMLEAPLALHKCGKFLPD